MMPLSPRRDGKPAFWVTQITSISASPISMEEFVWLLAYQGAVFGVFKTQEAGRAAMRELRQSLGGTWTEVQE